MKDLMKNLRRPDVLLDLHVYGGLATAAAGGWQLSPAVTAVAVGVVLFILGMLPALMANRRNDGN